ncbi:MAG: DUF488 domain-containing protein [Chloroflexi bacterium]|nr:MAG: DUF488 domain-containing protein [Chloroflexota bacterium]MBL1193479.1 DUF488 domain-containing protein [Chloroflexota bacterium]NOH10770.1 DUF488 domain-containing protein [Chloroflexota bacterium]
MPVKIKRVYEKASPGDGYRVLIDRLWPRGVKKEEANIDVWQKELAPSHELRKWFQHDPVKWEEFKERYYVELEMQTQLVEELRSQAETETVTIVYAAKDEEHSNAQALKELLENEDFT